MIGERIRILRTEKNLTQATLATELGIAKTTLASYEQGKNEPNITMLTKLIAFFNVSAEYLLGLTDVKSTKLEMIYIAKYLGLTERAITELHSYNEIALNGNVGMEQKIQTLNMLFSPNCELLENITAYLHFSATHFKNFNNHDNNALFPISELELWDDIAKESYSDDWDLWSKALLLIVEEELLALRQKIQVKKLARQSYNDEAEETFPCLD